MDVEPSMYVINTLKLQKQLVLSLTIAPMISVILPVLFVILVKLQVKCSNHRTQKEYTHYLLFKTFSAIALNAGIKNTDNV